MSHTPVTGASLPNCPMPMHLQKYKGRPQLPESRDLDESTLLEVHEADNVCALTFEQESTRTDVKQLTIEGIAA